MKALMIGATGATGKDLLQALIQDETVEQIDLFVRRALTVSSEKVNVHVIHFDKPEEWKSLVQGDVLFSCLGTTLKAAGSKEAQWTIDYDYQYAFAKAAKENQVATYVLVSAASASAKSKLFYTKMKGQLEEAITALNFPKTIIFNPALLIRKESDRKVEVLAKKVLQFLNQIGLFPSQKPLPTEVLAQAMINAAKTTKNGLTTLKAKAIWDMANRRETR